MRKNGWMFLIIFISILISIFEAAYEIHRYEKNIFTYPDIVR
jgi:hypothetical protein